MLLPLLCFFAFILSPTHSHSEDVAVPTVIIDQQPSEAQSPIDQYSIFKVEKVAKEKLKEASRQNLNDVVKDQVGVDSQVYCANCGAKRLTINGLKGEHTSILVDGIPMHSAVSSFYGIDSIPTMGIREIQVMRGAGASLTNAEAIGGTLNLVTVNPLDMANTYSTAVGVDDQLFGKSQNHSILYGLQSPQKKFGLALGGQFSRVEAWDVDKNNVSESPQRQNYSLLMKSRFLLGKKNDFSIRLGESHLEILGGYWDPTKPNQVRPLAAQESDFEDGSVEKKFIGDPIQITDWIKNDRTEAALTGTHYLSSKVTFDWKLGYAKQAQQSIYQHGFDYANVDNMVVGDTNVKITSGSSSIYTFGGFFKDQRLRSASETLFEQFPSTDPRDIKKDSFNFLSQALYAQYSYFIPETFELDIALRADKINIDWLELTNQINNTVLAPRVQILNHFTHHLKQRVTYGLGYRAPLTFFESQHGNNESGYQVDISDLEKSHSLVYSLSWNTPNYYITGGVHYTHLQNMAYGFESFNQPILYRNTDESYDIWVSDLLFGFKPYPWLLIESSIEFFNYEDGYKRKLPTAAIEQRYQLRSTIDTNSWSHSLQVTVVGERDLSKYGSYNEHYVNRNQASEPVLDPNLELKNQKSPTFFTVDSSVSYKLNSALVLNFRVNNIFDYTQAGVNDTPSAWHWHFNHAHFDGLHTWGPNTGRQYYLGISGEI